MMHADHFIFTAYGQWVPSCPRESWPRYIQSWERSRLSLQPYSEPSEPVAPEAKPAEPLDPYRLQRTAAEKTRHFPPVRFSPLQMQAIAEGFRRCAQLRYAWVWACSIMPEYVQLLVTSPRTPASQMMGLLRSEATRRLNELSMNPMSGYRSAAGQVPLMWSHTKWHQRLKNDEQVTEVIEYLQQLPVREGAEAQTWDFVRPFDGLDRCREETEEYAVA